MSEKWATWEDMGKKRTDWDKSRNDVVFKKNTRVRMKPPGDWDEKKQGEWQVRPGFGLTTEEEVRMNAALKVPIKVKGLEGVTERDISSLEFLQEDEELPGGGSEDIVINQQMADGTTETFTMERTDTIRDVRDKIRLREEEIAREAHLELEEQEAERAAALQRRNFSFPQRHPTLISFAKNVATGLASANPLSHHSNLVWAGDPEFGYASPVVPMINLRAFKKMIREGVDLGHGGLPPHIITDNEIQDIFVELDRDRDGLIPYAHGVELANPKPGSELHSDRCVQLAAVELPVEPAAEPDAPPPAPWDTGRGARGRGRGVARWDMEVAGLRDKASNANGVYALTEDEREGHRVWRQQEEASHNGHELSHDGYAWTVSLASTWSDGHAWVWAFVESEEPEPHRIPAAEWQVYDGEHWTDAPAEFAVRKAGARGRGGSKKRRNKSRKSKKSRVKRKTKRKRKSSSR